MPSGENISALNAENKARKHERMSGLCDYIQDRIDDGEFLGILPACKAIGIPLGTYFTWLNDPEFDAYRERINGIIRAGIKDRVMRAIYTGQGVQTVGVALGVLSRMDPEFSDKLKVDTTVSNVSVTNAYRPARRSATQDTPN